MFLEHFGLVEQPFGVTPDPRFLCLGPKHREALASLEYGTQTDRGFLALIARPGMGKTTLLYQYLELQRQIARSAYVFQTDCTSRDLLRHILLDLGLDSAGKDLPALRESLNGVLLEEMRAGRRFILVIDEAQNLSEKVLESVRLLSNFETPWKKLMQIVIAGQPQLADLLARPSLTQLRQRLSSIIRIEPFTPEETQQYIEHRLWVAGYQGPKLFTIGAQLAIAESSGGIPRNINMICFNSMSLAYARGVRRIDSKIVRESLGDVEIESLASDARFSRFAPALPKSFTALQLLDCRPDMPAENGRDVLATAPPAKTSRSWRSLPLSLSAACVMAFAFLSAPIAIAGWSAAPAGIFLTTSAALPPAPATASAVPAASAAAAGPNPTAPSFKVPWHAPAPYVEVVLPAGTTLRHLSLEYLGRFDAATQSAIWVLNPEITDPNRIAAGQTVRLPAPLWRAAGERTPNPSKTPSLETREVRP
ncbi:MAG TPA: AAA family ATPase [Verrucomicrobiae bacterium]|nr:AAA family ATPase [Verrucomicrobiae bacterium]